ncbi:MAG TPA: hypothetical protein VHW91_02285 [Candidatus Dormibacteraeota bacterium]|jgi:hypothetical protein|nr:hypothetical protein [Candidatus Dormibacteraeota bacterium]
MRVLEIRLLGLGKNLLRRGRAQGRYAARCGDRGGDQNEQPTRDGGYPWTTWAAGGAAIVTPVL